MKRRLLWLSSGASFALLLVFSMLSAQVHAASIPPRLLSFHPTQRAGLYQKLRALPKQSVDNLVYNGGPVMAGTTQTYAIFWEPTGSSVSTNYNNLILRYFSDIGSSPLYHNNTQYTDSQGNAPSGSTLGGSWVDTQTPYPSSTLTDSDIQQEVANAIQVNGWTPSIQNLFVVFTALNETNDAGTAYHSNFNTDTIYATVPDIFASWHVFPGNSPNNDVDADSTILVTSHEQTEAATDPEPASGWVDNSGMEIGDKCEKYFGQQNADGSNVTWNGHPYIVQGEWDNTIGACTLTGP